MGQSSWAKLTSATDSFQADLLLGRLRQEGIDAQAMKSFNAPGAWLTGNENPFGPIDVCVPSDQLPAAQKLLDDLEPSQPATPEERAPTNLVKVIGAALAVASIVAVLASVLSDTLS